MFKEKDNNRFLCWYYIKNKSLLFPEYFDANNIFSRPFIQNIKHKPNRVQDLSKQIMKALKKHILENSVEHKIHQIQHITGINGKIEYHGWTYAKKTELH